jgi:flavin-dependent dehydrogenase
MKQSKSYNVVVVGGGTAGWSCAALLSTNENINVTVIEPSDIPTIGVGESTIPYMNIIHTKMNMRVFDTPDWIKKVDGTLKFSIEFADYDYIGSKWIHPFTNPDSRDFEMTMRTLSDDIPLDTYSCQEDYVIDNYVLANLRSKQFTHYYEQYDRYYTSGVGYHINAGLYAELLKEESLKRDNCSYLDDSVEHVVLKDLSRNKEIEYLVLKNNNTITADLFVDCTGFKGLLISKVDSPWDSSYSERLFVDTALAVQLPYLNKETQLRNTTYCHALGYGWVWNVPLQSRIGTGYVFSQKHTTTEQATEEFKQHLHDLYGYDKKDINPRVVNFDVGKRPESWKSNVVAVGLSSFFLEPIESTAIAHLQHQADTILDMLSADYITMENKRKRFNYLNNMSLDAIASYIELHYIFSKRRDTKFWKDFTSVPLTKEQKTLLKKYIEENNYFDTSSIKEFYGGHSIFDKSSHLFLYLGFDIAPNKSDQWVEKIL